MGRVLLRKLSLSDGQKELEFLRTVPLDENGFTNPASIDELEDVSAFAGFLERRHNESEGVNLAEGRVSASIFWVDMEGEIVGVVSIRHELNDFLRNVGGGHIGIGGIPKKYRGQGIGSEALRQTVDLLRNMGVDDVLITAHKSNLASRRMIEKCGGVLEKSIPHHQIEGEEELFYWIRSDEMELQK